MLHDGTKALHAASPICVQLAHVSIGDWKDISIAHVIIIIKSEVSTPFLSYFSMVVCLRCLLHHILSLIAYTFQENWEFVFIIIVQFMMSAKIWIRFGLQIVLVCLYSTPSHYHHCANLSEGIELIKYLSDIFCRVCKIKHILSVIHYTICGLHVFSLPISLVMIERIYILCLIIIIKSKVWTITHSLGLGHETMVSAVCLSIFFWTNNDSSLLKSFGIHMRAISQSAHATTILYNVFKKTSVFTITHVRSSQTGCCDWRTSKTLTKLVRSDK